MADFWDKLGKGVEALGNKSADTVSSGFWGAVSGGAIGGAGALGVGSIAAVAVAATTAGLTMWPVLAAYGAAAACASIMAVPGPVSKILGGIAVGIVCVAAAGIIGPFAAAAVAVGAGMFGFMAPEAVKYGAAGGGIISGVKSLLGIGKKKDATNETSQQQSREQNTPQQTRSEDRAPAQEEPQATNTFQPVDAAQPTAEVAKSARAAYAANSPELAAFDLAVIKKYMNDARVMDSLDSRMAIEAAYAKATEAALKAGMTVDQIKAIQEIDTKQFENLSAVTLHDFGATYDMDAAINITMNAYGRDMVAQHRESIGYKTKVQLQIIEDQKKLKNEPTDYSKMFDSGDIKTNLIKSVPEEKNLSTNLSPESTAANQELQNKYGNKYDLLPDDVKKYLVGEQVRANELFGSTNGGRDQSQAEVIEDSIQKIIEEKSAHITGGSNASSIEGSTTHSNKENEARVMALFS